MGAGYNQTLKKLSAIPCLKLWAGGNHFKMVYRQHQIILNKASGFKAIIKAFKVPVPALGKRNFT